METEQALQPIVDMVPQNFFNAYNHNMLQVFLFQLLSVFL